MKRYIKVNGQWVDTLEQQKAGYYYFVIDNIVYYLSDETMTDVKIGDLQGETDNFEDLY